MDAVAVVISGLALLASSWAIIVARGARRDARALGHLDLEPHVEIDARPHQLGGNPPHYVVRNAGPVEAVQLTVDLISMRYDAERNRIRFYSAGSEESRHVGTLAPHKEVTFQFESHFLDVNARLAAPVEHNVLAIRATYRRDADRRRFVARTFYFVNPDGQWVSERDSSLPELYGPIIDAAHASTPDQPRYLGADPVHRVTDDESG